MKKVLLGFGFFMLIGFLMSFTALDTIKWSDFEEALAQNEENPKRILVNVYTEGCGWCEIMEKKTFKDPVLVDYLNSNFYTVGLDAKSKKAITFHNKVYNGQSDTSKNQHELADFFLNGKKNYPSFVILNKNLEVEKIISGYKKPQGFLAELKNRK